MQDKCCCGCFFLSTGTAIALSVSAIQALIGLLWNIELLMLVNETGGSNPLDHFIDIKTIEELDVVHGLILAGIGLNAFWLLFAIIAARGNVTLQHGRLLFWDRLTVLISIFDLAAAIFFAVRLQTIFAESPDFFQDSKPTKTLTYLTLLVAFSKGGITIFFNVYLAHVVQMRGKEINNDHSVLAMYIISHISRTKTLHNNNAANRPEPPPAYASSSPYYVPPPPTSRNENRSDSSESQWSLSYDAIQQGMSIEPPKYVPTSGKKKCSSLEFARALSRESCYETEDVITEINTSPEVP
ncbi:uncharacterized protein TNCT_655741 [Trichonephila clavata]|uniref:Uncharacterized protein n=1 Tax=Trichonephila clavata TaxID=2740835 RepID=A0A8X6F745_TRICU|nr:uncharacterized protein TNCT_655741 [Trichonephila clavata]